MRFKITSVDYAPDELYEQVPIRGRILRQIDGSDRPDYYIATLDRPVIWKKEKEAAEVSISHLVLAARWVGGVISPSMKATPVNIAFVTDMSLLSDVRLDFKKSYYAAIGVADGEPEQSFFEKLRFWRK